MTPSDEEPEMLLQHRIVAKKHHAPGATEAIAHSFYPSALLVAGSNWQMPLKYVMIYSYTAPEQTSADDELRYKPQTTKEYTTRYPTPETGPSQPGQ